MVRRVVLVVLALFIVSVSCVDPAFAAKKKKKKNGGTPVADGAYYSTEVSYKLGKKTKKEMIECLGPQAGDVKSTSSGKMFTSFSKLANKSSGLKKTKYKALAKAGKGACVNPDFLSLDQYKGPWGETQVRRLLAVFANGGKESWVQNFISKGLTSTVDDLLTVKPDPYVDALGSKLSCDTNPDDNQMNCYPYQAGSDPNDYYLDGFISWLNLRSIYTVNPVYDVLAQFVLDERAPGDPRVLGGCNRYYFRDYIAFVDQFAKSGDYKQYVRNVINSPFLHGRWLSGDSNHPVAYTGTGNEDMAREIMELVVLGTVDKNGQKNYTDLDVYIVSLILSGLDETSNNGYCSIGYHPDLSSPGTHTVFSGTPYQMSVGSGFGFAYPGLEFVELLMAVKKKQMAWELARRLWPRFINSKATPFAIQKLADVIEAHDFKLWPVMRTMMESRAFYSPLSDRTIIKTPFTLFVTYARQLGMPVEDYNSVRNWLTDIGMLIGRPPTVFGFSYHLKELASDFYQQFRFNSMFYYTMWQDLGDIEDIYGWTPHNGLIAGISLTGDPAADITNSLLKRFNLLSVTTQGQKDQYNEFLNNSLGGCYSNQDPECFYLNGNHVKLYREAPDLGDVDSDFYRERLLAVMLGSSDAFGVM